MEADLTPLADLAQQFIDVTTPVVGATELSTVTIVWQYITLSVFIFLATSQVPLLIGMIVVMKYEWIIASFYSFGFLLWPILNVLFMFSDKLQKQLLRPDTLWSIWFIFLG